MVPDLEARDVGFRSLNEAVDTGSARGKLVFHMFAALAELKRTLIRERTSGGSCGCLGPRAQRRSATQAFAGSNAQGQSDAA